MLQFRGAIVTSDAGLLANRELDDALGLTTAAGDLLADTRTGKSGRDTLVGMLRQSIFGRLAGSEEPFIPRKYKSVSVRMTREDALALVDLHVCIVHGGPAYVREHNPEGMVVEVTETQLFMKDPQRPLDEPRGWHLSPIAKIRRKSPWLTKTQVSKFGAGETGVESRSGSDPIDRETASR